ncbi:hypothetical protein [Falsiroseomonas stagni]|uniref:Uncharacterized protein n=1 Tax=Falsiroseomonas stagni DSM 19981 TaxID=1123062 RepID=A0A1I4F7K4_9PROT|nr:hypothetical protein [Falsiroseomonas stagni]SFL13270.1 hypothetical protein SAMN02745775_12339 [Falsiroseomonas stagni DSM 19981]
MTDSIPIGIPVVPEAGSGSGSLRRYVFWLLPEADTARVQPYGLDDGQATPIRESGTLVIGALPGKLPGLSSQAVGVALQDPGGGAVLGVSGRSSMLAGALGFLAAHLLPPERWATLPPLIATGRIEPVPARAGSPLTGLAVRAVDGVPGKLAAIQAAAPPPGLLLLPAEDHPADAARAAEIHRLIGALTRTGHEVRRVRSLDEALVAWMPELAGTSGPIAAGAGMAGPPRRPWRWVAGLAAAAAGALFVPAALQSWRNDGASVEAALLAQRIVADPEGLCASLPSLQRAGGDAALRAQAVCAALARCDAAAGHRLDPDRRAAGLTGGISGPFLAVPERAAAARDACKAAVELAPQAAKARWHLSRALEAQQDETAAQRERALAAERGEPMSRLRLAQEALLARDSAPAGREQLALLVRRPQPPPEAVQWLAVARLCGIGGASDPAGALSLTPLLREMARRFAEDAEFPNAALGLAELLERPGAMTVPPGLCPMTPA